jgi:putative DNA primase/helicase
MLAIDHEALDADPWLLNVKNGTLDLRTGTLGPHRRDALITKTAPVAYDVSATAPTWTAFLDRAMGGDASLVGYLQRLVGYALTGALREHVLVFLYGAGANGKSTFLSTIHTLLGEYATPAPRGVLFRSRGERHPTELATFFGRRFVTCSEIEEGQVFDEALVKDLTGGDRIECRRMREDFWMFTPTHKLFLAGNHKPTIRGDDEGIWRRMKLVPWTVTIPEHERDTTLLERLRAELPGILRWAVEGCLDWQTRGLSEPDGVRGATAAYRAENDALGEFFRLHVVFEARASISRRELRRAYETWCTDNGHSPQAARRFSARLRESGVVGTNVRAGLQVLDGWRNVRLVNARELDERAKADERCTPMAAPKSPDALSLQTAADSASRALESSAPIDQGDLLADWLATQDIARRTSAPSSV